MDKARLIALANEHGTHMLRGDDDWYEFYIEDLERLAAALSAQPQDHHCALRRGGVICRICDQQVIDAAQPPSAQREPVAVISERSLQRLASGKAHCVHAYAKVVDEDDVKLYRHPGQRAEPQGLTAAEIDEAIDGVEEPRYYGYENPNTFQDGVRAATKAIREALASKEQT